MQDIFSAVLIVGIRALRGLAKALEKRVVEHTGFEEAPPRKTDPLAQRLMILRERHPDAPDAWLEFVASRLGENDLDLAEIRKAAEPATTPRNRAVVGRMGPDSAPTPAPTGDSKPKAADHIPPAPIAGRDFARPPVDPASQDDTEHVRHPKQPSLDISRSTPLRRDRRDAAEHAAVMPVKLPRPTFSEPHAAAARDDVFNGSPIGLPKPAPKMPATAWPEQRAAASHGPRVVFFHDDGQSVRNGRNFPLSPRPSAPSSAAPRETPSRPKPARVALVWAEEEQAAPSNGARATFVDSRDLAAQIIPAFSAAQPLPERKERRAPEFHAGEAVERNAWQFAGTSFADSPLADQWPDLPEMPQDTIPASDLDEQRMARLARDQVERSWNG